MIAELGALAAIVAMVASLAQGLLGRKVGDKVEIPVPAGTMKFEIREIKYEE